MLEAFWVLHRPASPTQQALALRLLHAVAGSPATAWSGAAQGGVLYALSVLLPVKRSQQPQAQASTSTRCAAASGLTFPMLLPD